MHEDLPRQDATSEPLKGKKIAVIGYGSQGHAHALNLRDSGMDVMRRPARATARRGRRPRPRGSAVVDTADRGARGRRRHDARARRAGRRDLRARDRARPDATGKYLAFGHGFNIHFKKIVPPAGVNVFMVAPKGPGPPGAQRVPEGPRRAVPARHPPGSERRHARRSGSPTRRPSAARARRCSRPPSRKRPRPISSASRRCSAAASPSSSAPATRRSSRPATRPRWRTSSACTR